ncbi:MAG: PASTA domain-containing protein, partial [Bergeyella zoohelcum]|nr:PASTA domain-containing protein [Bergeyella zoohelcum]
VNKKVNLNKLTKQSVKIKFEKNTMPNVLGFVGQSVIPQLENEGYRVDYKGVGKVVEQFPTAGTIIKKDQKIYLKLQR